MRGTTKKPHPAIDDEELNEGAPGAAEESPYITPFDCSGGAGRFQEQIPLGAEVPLSAGKAGCYEIVNGKRVKVSAEQ